MPTWSRTAFLVLLYVLIIAVSVPPLFFSIVPITFCGGNAFLACAGAAAAFGLPSAAVIILATLALTHLKHARKLKIFGVSALIILAAQYAFFAYFGIAGIFVPFL